MNGDDILAQRFPEIRLAEIDGLVAELAKRIRSSGFEPELVVYIETGARLIAAGICRELGVPGVGVSASRPGVGIKAWLAPLVARFPRKIKDMLRSIEERGRVHGRSGRHVRWPAGVECAGRRVLLVDDAADTGRTIQAVRAELLVRGVPASALRVAVLAVTTPAAWGVVDFHVLERNCRLPWSADSTERKKALRKMREEAPPLP